ncbi:APC family permease [Jiulongibacter sediminis]|uniref:Amino acid transporter n=1 Tax=Jiulongibacter sediminis TaxID=1605367 RepID=A0A0P7C896_9BACT|nr:APC family permease [Jiulongibacter sediminis]KPM48723.1 amino acid transporter [Jiulongibacter sediminis]TBX25258.1 amino acid transporter [Jiulongibacter sediminis]
MSSKIGLKDAVSIGIGGMVGGGIFAVLGLAVTLAKGATPLAFLLAGLLALITAYSYAKLSIAYPDSGGTVRFVNEGFGKSIFAGGINNLLWVSYIIMLGLYASAFGSYAPNLLTMISEEVDFHIFASAVVILATVINYYSVEVVGKIESVAVFVKLIILIAFIGVSIYGLTQQNHLAQLNPGSWEAPLTIISGGMVIFVAYEGFELIANSVPDIENPKINVPRAYYISVGFVVVLYVIIAFATVGSLTFEKIQEAEEYVLASAARPVLGQVGFTIMTIAALISTFSAINASLYGGSRVSYEIAEDDELPHQLTYKLWNQPVGLIITTIATLVLVNTLELESISTAGSIGFLIVFAVVNYSGYKLSREIKASRWLPMTGFILCLTALAALIQQEFSDNKTGVLVAAGIIAICFLMEWVYKKVAKK